MTQLETCLINHEGLEHHVYVDSLGFSTIGIGRNISHTGPGLSTDECLYLLRNDIQRVTSEITDYGWFKSQDSVRREVLIELAFNMGVNGLLEFKETLNLIQNKKYSQACAALQDSKWSHQVGKERVENICKRLETGNY